MEAWEIRIEPVRIEDSLPTFIIFCEDEVSEPIYFKYFETDLIKVNPIGGQRSKYENVLRAITHCVEKGINLETKRKSVVGKEDVQVWCVFDRDKEGLSEKENFGDTDFDQSINTAASNRIKVAWSNDSFELWVLLHFEDVDPTTKDSRHRRYYYERLTEIFLSLPNPGNDLKRLTSISSFNYKEAMKGKKHFTNIVRNEIVGKTHEAVNRARMLERYHESNPTIGAHEKAPCTLAHHLVLELIRLGGKNTVG